MEWTFQPVEPARPPAAETEPAVHKTSGIRRTVLTAAVSALLLVGGGVAAVSAASPDPSAAPSTAPSGAPSGGTGAPRTHTGSTADCPNMGGDSGSGSSGSSGGSSTSPAPTPAT